MLTQDEMVVNGRHCPLWSQFIEKKEEWVGGVLEDMDDDYIPLLESKIENCFTEITDIQLNLNGKESAFFTVIGKDFNCGFDVSVGEVTRGEDGYITFRGYGGHTWRIKKPVN